MLPYEVVSEVLFVFQIHKTLHVEEPRRTQQSQQTNYYFSFATKLAKSSVVVASINLVCIN